MRGVAAEDVVENLGSWAFPSVNRHPSRLLCIEDPPGASCIQLRLPLLLEDRLQKVTCLGKSDG